MSMFSCDREHGYTANHLRGSQIQRVVGIVCSVVIATVLKSDRNITELQEYGDCNSTRLIILIRTNNAW